MWEVIKYVVRLDVLGLYWLLFPCISPIVLGT